MSVLDEFSKYDAMSTEALNQILQQDFLNPGNDELDADAILYITRILDEREQDGPYKPSAAAETEAAWQRFREQFIAPDGLRLGEEIHSATADSAHPAKKLSVRTLRTLLLVAVMAVLLVGGTYAAGVFGWLPEWNRDYFSFAPVEDTTEATVCTSLEEALAFHNAPPNVVPQRFPVGYELAEFHYTPFSSAYATFGCVYSDGTNCIVLSYAVFYTDNHRVFAKDEDNPDTYTVSGIDHYIMTNDDQYIAVWQNGNFECSLSGFTSREDLFRVIDSMY